jgi:hypothetical protein
MHFQVTATWHANDSPIHQSSEHLPRLVAIVVDGLLTQDDEGRFLLDTDRFHQLGHVDRQGCLSESREYASGQRGGGVSAGVSAIVSAMVSA